MATPTPAHQAAIANLYIALFNRAPDASGFAFWTQALADGASLETLVQNFVKTPEAQVIYPASQTTAQFVTAYYTNVLGRPVDASGLAYWSKMLDDAGGVTSDFARALVVAKIVDIVNTPLPVKPADLTDAAYALTFADRNAFKNKVDMSIFYAVEYKGEDVNLAKQVLAVIGPNTGTVDIGKGLLNPPTSGGGTTPPVAVSKHFTGTAAFNESFIGGDADDTFEFVIDKTTPGNTTLNLKDVITGGGGNDTLTVTVTGNIANSDFTDASITGIETLVIKRTGASSITYDAGVGVESITVEGGSGNVQLNNLADGTKFVAKGSTGGNFTGTYAGLGPVDVTVSGVSGTYVTAATAATSVKLTSTGTGSTLTGFNTGPSVTTFKIVADAAFSTAYLNGGSSAGKVEVSGAASVNLGTLDRTFKVFDASANTGGLTATLASNNLVVKVTGSAGSDTIYTGVALTTGSVDVGADTGDRLVVTNSAALADATLGGKYIGFDILRVEDGVTVDLDNIGGITSVEINDAGGATGVTNLSVGQAAAVTIISANSGTGAITIGVTDKGAADTVKASVTTDAANGAADVNLTGLTLTNVEKLELTGNGNTFANNGVLTLTTANATTLDSIIVKNAGDVAITISAGHVAAGLSIDASGAAGSSTINASAYNTVTGVTINGGAGGGTLTGSTKADTIVGGAGNDTIISNGGADTLTGNGGANTFVFSTPDLDTTAGAVTGTITDFKTGIDKIALTATGPFNTINSYREASFISANLSVLLIDATGVLSQTIRVYVGQVGADSYVVSDADGNGYTEVIKLTGVALNQIEYGDFINVGAPPPP